MPRMQVVEVQVVQAAVVLGSTVGIVLAEAEVQVEVQEF